MLISIIQHEQRKHYVQIPLILLFFFKFSFLILYLGLLS